MTFSTLLTVHDLEAKGESSDYSVCKFEPCIQLQDWVQGCLDRITQKKTADDDMSYG